MSAAIGLIRVRQTECRGMNMKGKGGRPDYSKKSFIIIGTHGEEDIEKATMTFACASASASLGVKTKVFLTGNAVKLAQKGYANRLPAVRGMASIKELMTAFLGCGGKLMVCIPCLESRGIDKSNFLDGTQFINLVDFTTETLDADRVFTC